MSYGNNFDVALAPSAGDALSGGAGDGMEEHAGAADANAMFRQLVHSHQKRLYRFVVKNIGQGADAEDLTQQAFVEAFKAHASFRGASELSTWLYGIAMNLVRNYLSRAPHRRFTFEDEDALADTCSDGPDPSEQLALTQMIKALQKEVNNLPVEMRDVLLMVAMDEMSYEEAAVMLSVPVGTVRSRISRARSTLRRRLTATRHHLGFEAVFGVAQAA